MMYRVLFCVAWLAGALAVSAAVKLDSLTVGSVTYSNVTVFGANATDLFFTSDQGSGNAKLKYLSKELQEQFHYDPTNSSKVEQQQIANDQWYQQSLAATLSAQAQAAHRGEALQTQKPYAEAGLADPVSDDSPLGKPAPDLDFAKWIGQAPDLTGKFAIISVWSPKSASSRRWIAPMNDLHRVLAGKVEVVGVTTASEADVDQVTPKIEFPCAIDPDGKFLSAAHITSLPCVLLVDTNHIVRYEGHPAAVTTNTLQMLFKGTDEEPVGK
jgi:hypothetical protein